MVICMEGIVMLKKLKVKYINMPVQVKATFWFFVCSILQKGISTITTPIFTRLLSTTEYGQFGVYNSWLGIVSIFVTLRLSTGVYAQGLIKFEEDRLKFVSSMQGLSTTLSVIFLGIYWCTQSFWNDLFDVTTAQMLAMFAMIWATSVFEFWASEQRVLYSYKTLVIVTLLVSLAKPAISILFVVNSVDKVSARIFGIAIVEVIGYSGLFLYQMAKGRCFFSKKYWLYSLRFNIPLVPHYLSQVILNSSDRIMIEKMVGDSEAGIYGLAYSISQIMVLFNTALMSTIGPWIYRKIKDEKYQDISKISYMALGGIACVNLLLIAFAPEIVAVFAPVEYYDAIWIIPPVAMSVYFMFSYDLFAKFEFYYEKTHYIPFASGVGAILNVILNYYFIDMFGYYAAGYTTLFCFIAYALCHYLFMKKVCKNYLNNVKVYNGRILLMIAMSFLAIGFLFMFMYNFSAFRYMVLFLFVLGGWLMRKKIINGIKCILNKG